MNSGVNPPNRPKRFLGFTFPGMRPKFYLTALGLAAGILNGCNESKSISRVPGSLTCSASLDQMANDLRAAGSLPGSLADPGDTGGIVVLRAYPPIAGLDPDLPTYNRYIEDSLAPESERFARPYQIGLAIFWFPPIAAKDTLGMSPIVDLTRPEPMPFDMAALQVVVREAYIANVRIYDQASGIRVRSFTYDFGRHGEFNNAQRLTPKGFVSFITWDQKNDSGAPSGTKVYRWEVDFLMKNGKGESYSILSGVVGRDCIGDL